MNLAERANTLVDLALHLAKRGRFFLIPMFLVLLLAGALLIATNGLSYVAPFWYAIF